MLITKEITIDLQRRGILEPVEAVQCDANTRAVKVTLLSGGENWTPPAGAVASVAFKKPDGTSGWYDKLPDGTAACAVAGNTVTAIFAPQLLTAAGKVSVAVIFQDSQLNQLATFVFTVAVQANPTAGKNISNDYYKYSTMEQIDAAVDAWLTETEAEKNDFLSKADAALAAMRDVITASDSAPAIVCEATGEVIAVSDSSDRLLHGLTLYGKTIQNGTPSPSNPVELVSVGANGVIKTYVCGKNVFDESKGFTYGTVHPLLIPAGTKVTFSAFPIAGNVRLNYRLYYADGTSSAADSLVGLNAANNAWYTAVLTAAKDVTGVSIYNSGDGTARTAKAMVRIGSYSTTTNADYEAFKGQTLTASTPDGLPGIPVSSGGNYTDENGQQWICDEKDFARGVHVQRVYQETFALSKFSKAQGVNTASYYVAPKYVAKWSVAGLCSVLPQDKFLYSTGDAEHWYADASMYLFIANANVSVFEANESVTITYALATPIETPLSAEELASYAALHTNKPNTTLYNDAGAGLKLEYNADTKSYIDSKINMVVSAIVNNT